MLKKIFDMKINTAVILCAGFGSRLAPITDTIPKPLIKIKNENLLQKTINLVEELGIKKIKINTFYLKEQIIDYTDSLQTQLNFEIFSDGEEILGTGGGLFNIIKNSNEDNFLVFNPDTIWNSNYIEIISNMEKFYFLKNIKNLLMVVRKKNSFDKRFKGDFSLINNILRKYKTNDFVYTGCQIVHRDIFKNTQNKKFSISEIWDNLILDNQLYGYESKENFLHIADYKIFKDLTN